MKEYRIGNKTFSPGGYYRRLRRAKELGCKPEDVPDMRGRHSEGHRGARNPRWNPGRLTTSHGYILRRVEKGHPHGFGNSKVFDYCYEHIYVMTKHIGRPLAPGEVVHHRNGDKTDNRLENLELTISKTHMRPHGQATAKNRPRRKDGTFLPRDGAKEATDAHETATD